MTTTEPTKIIGSGDDQFAQFGQDRQHAETHKRTGFSIPAATNELLTMTEEAPIGRNWHTVLPDGIRPEPIEDDAKTVQVPSLRRVLTSQERAWLNDYNTLVRTWAGIRWYAKLGVKATVPYYYATVAARFVGELPSKLAGERVQGAEVAN